MNNGGGIFVEFEDKAELKYLLKILFKVKLYQEELNNMRHKEESLKKIPFYINDKNARHKTGDEDKLTYNNVIIEEEFDHLFDKIIQYSIDYNMRWRLPHPKISEQLEREREERVKRWEELK